VDAARGTTVLLVGETGTGKELFARGIHYEGAAAAEPFVAVNCAAIPETLLESELFGHEKGAFTDARANKAGLMEVAGGGTLFLDEIHHLPHALQPKLLRALEERSVRRLGGVDEIPVRCRIIAATNVTLEHAVRSNEFREDLFYRLNVFRIALPALRERPEDVTAIAQHFLAELARSQGGALRRLRADAIEALSAHRWPGNIRELKNVIERAAILCDGGQAIRAEHLMIQQRTARPAVMDDGADPYTGHGIAIPPNGKTLAAIEREAVLITLRLANGNRSECARLLGVSRPTLARKLREAGVGPASGARVE
jgi:transcriptional regulator with PAS, ATPase and Fis domain